jgi:hypothetical protein
LKPQRFPAWVALVLGASLAACGEADVPSHLTREARLPVEVRADPGSFCRAALAVAERVAPEVATNTSNWTATGQPWGRGADAQELSCFFDAPDGEQWIVALKSNCGDATNTECVTLVGLSSGTRGWISPEYQPDFDGRVQRLEVPREAGAQ